jgi:Tfp pilus assembly protein PilZ
MGVQRVRLRLITNQQIISPSKTDQEPTIFIRVTIIGTHLRVKIGTQVAVITDFLSGFRKSISGIGIAFPETDAGLDSNTWELGLFR